MIKDEKLWLRALQARNNVTHSYNQNIALGIVNDAKNEFYKMFTELKEEVEDGWYDSISWRVSGRKKARNQGRL